MGITFFSTGVYQSNIAFSVVHVQVLYITCAQSGWFVRMGHPILTIMFEIILRTFQAEILKMFKNIQPQPKN